MPSCATATRSSAPTSSTTAATRGWARPGATSTSPRWAARRSGRTRPTATRRPRRTSGGTCTTSTATRHDLRARGRGSGRGAPPLGHGGRRDGRAGRAQLDQPAPAPPPVSTGHTLRIERTFQAPAQAVFEAWTSEEVMRRWWHAEHDWETSEASVDLRVGGEVRVVMRDPRQDAEYGGGGGYTGNDPPRPLAVTRVWGDKATRVLIEIHFQERDGATTGPLPPNGLWGEG